MPLVMNFPFSKTPFTEFAGRRSVVHSLKGMVACLQPLAATVGQGILAAWGERSCKCIQSTWGEQDRIFGSTAATFNVTEPGSTGTSGDMFCLFYHANHKKVYALNGFGRSLLNLTLDTARDALKMPSDQVGSIPLTSVLAVTNTHTHTVWK
jgi:gamma-glutamyltranspeptidase/glutathione hydrolase